MLAPLIMEGSASGNSTLVTICMGLAPIARAASIKPKGTSNKLFSTIRAMKGAAPILNGTRAACTPIEVPTSIRVKGIIQTIRMIKGIARKILTTTDTTRLSQRFSISWPSRVRNNNTPVGRPITKPKNPDKKVITMVSQVPLINNCIMASDISQSCYAYLMIFKKFNSPFPLFGLVKKGDQHNPELNPGCMVQLRADNLEIHSDGAGHIGQDRGRGRLARNFQFEQGDLALSKFRGQPLLVLFRNLHMQGRGNKLLSQFRFRI